jgi:hypothetical protein
MKCPRIGQLALDSDSTSAGFPERRGRHSHFHFNADVPEPVLSGTRSLSLGIETLRASREEKERASILAGDSGTTSLSLDVPIWILREFLAT